MKFCPICGNNLIIAEEGGKQRQRCSSATCNYVFWDNPVPVVAAIVEIDDRVVMARGVGWPEGMYGLITGFLEKEETPESAILREVKEELNLIGEIVSFIGYYSFYEMNQLILAFHVKAEGEIITNEEISEIMLVPPEELEPWPFGTGYAIRDWLDKRGDR
ncbi:MAG: NUDIX domain-containing protein [Spirochaetota bacterium]|nr:NUDIX domain-containing protein [Spirochaetota bacterium]